MFIRILTVSILFLLLPLVGVAAQVLGDYILLTEWDYINIFLSISFSLVFSMRRMNFSKVLSGMLFISILMQEITKSFSSIEGNYSNIILVVFEIAYKSILLFLVYHYIFKAKLIDGQKTNKPE